MGRVDSHDQRNWLLAGPASKTTPTLTSTGSRTRLQSSKAESGQPNNPINRTQAIRPSQVIGALAGLEIEENECRRYIESRMVSDRKFPYKKDALATFIEEIELELPETPVNIAEALLSHGVWHIPVQPRSECRFFVTLTVANYRFMLTRDIDGRSTPGNTSARSGTQEIIG